MVLVSQKTLYYVPSYFVNQNKNDIALVEIPYSSDNAYNIGLIFSSDAIENADHFVEHLGIRLEDPTSKYFEYIYPLEQ